MANLGKIKEITDIVEDGMEGMLVRTNRTAVKVLIDAQPQCCENFGYMISEDNPADFIGKELMAVNLTDTALKSVELKLMEEDYHSDSGDPLYAGQIMFVNFVTRAGVFQIAAYNAHNGYYGHTVKVVQGDTILLDDIL